MAVAAGFGVLIGPGLAGLTLRIPVSEPCWPAGWWHGAGVGRRRLSVVTAASMVSLGLAGAGIGFAGALPAYLWFGAIAVVLTVIDVEHHRLPNRLTYPSYPAGLLLLGAASLAGHAGQAYLRALLTMVALLTASLLVAVISPTALGLGDVKLTGLLGLYLGWLGTGFVLLGIGFGVLVGAAMAVGLLATGRAGLHSEIAYGPPLLVGGMVSVGFGGPLLDAYLAMAGLR